jgi:hypothetical protein
MEEIIVILDNYPNYELSSKGYIRNRITNNTLNLEHGHITLSKQGGGATAFNLAMLFAENFIPNDQKFPRARVIDENHVPKYSIENIKWCFKSEDLTGRQIGMLTLLRLCNVEGKPYYDCVCSCGNKINRPHSYFTNTRGRKSCGCTLSIPRKHGMVGELTYIRWSAMKTRATNPNFSRADRYFEKGIGMCPSWKDFCTFLEDMGECPSKEHSLDRIDSEGDYCKDNCRWVTQDIQTFNKLSKSEMSGRITGVYLHESGSWDARWYQNNRQCSKRFKVFIEAVKFRQEKELELYGMTKIDTENLNIMAYY